MRYRHATILVATLVLCSAALWMAAASARAAGSIAFVDAHRGWRVTLDGSVLYGGKAVAWRTVDGGDTWKRLASYPAGLSGDGGYSGGIVTFANSREGLWGRSGRGLLASGNSGSTWQRAGNPMGHELLDDLGFGSSRVAWACTRTGSMEEGGSIIRSTNSGATWRIVKHIESHSGEIPAGGFSGVSSPDPQTCFVSGRGRQLSGLWATTDGGKHWARRKVPGGNAGQVDFPSSTTGWVIADGICKTSNGGRTWTKQLSAGGAMDFVDLRHGWVLDWDGTVFRTVDGGKTWARLGTVVNDRPSEIVFADQEHGWVTSWTGDYPDYRQLLFRTTDGGETWTELP